MAIGVSLIITCKNEEKTIKGLLDSVVKQSKKPNELVIIDGGSTDSTVDIIRSYAKRYSWIRVAISNGASVGKGRNIAVTKARNPIIAVTDVGCILEKDWLKNISQPFLKEDVDVVVGTYKPYHENDFEYFQGMLTTPPNQERAERAKWTSKSLAFRKKVWIKVNGYPNLSTGEDTNFHLKLFKHGCKYVFAKNAIVYWHMRKMWKDFFKQFYYYGRGDKKSGNLWNQKYKLIIVFGFWAYLLATLIFLITEPPVANLLISLFLLYFILYGLKLALMSKKLEGIFYGFFLLLIKRIAFILGATFG